MKPSTTVRASRSSLPIRASTLGSTNLAPGMALPSASRAILRLPRSEEVRRKGSEEVSQEGTSSLPHFLTFSLSHFLTFSLPYILTCKLHPRLGNGHHLQQFVDDLIGGDAFGLGAEVGEH